MLNRQTKIFLMSLAVIAAISLLTISLLSKEEEEVYKPGTDFELDRAVNQAQAVYKQKKQLGYDFTDGPCLTNDLIPDWVADLVHNPRQSEDDLAKNQCQALLEGRATHFVELDLEGNLVRVK